MQHGADIYTYAKFANCEPSELIDFSSNINFYDPAVRPKADTKRYGDATYKELTKSIAKRYDLKKSNVTLYNGASSAIFSLFAYLRSKEVVLYAPLYGEYEKAAKLYGGALYKVNRFKELYSKPPKRALVVFVNPATPDGRYYDLKKLFKIWKKQDNTVILDESFLEFEGLKSFRKYIKKFKKLYIIHSFSKFYACAGIRIGAVFTHASNAKALKRHIPMWHLSSFDAAFLQERLKDEKFVKKAQKLHKKRKKELEKILKRHFEVFPSDANFFLVKTDRKELFDTLLLQKILVRPCESFDFLDDGYIRFAVKDKKSHNKLARVLERV